MIHHMRVNQENWQRWHSTPVIYFVTADRYDSNVQSYISAELNSFSGQSQNGGPRNIPCGSSIVLDGILPGCKGYRLQKQVIVEQPKILELVMMGEYDNSIRSPSHFEFWINVHDMYRHYQ